MSKCIQVSCSCTGYEEPTQSKNTLLQFRLNCQGCGHQASEHRKLTAVDQFIKSEVGAGRRSKCSASILPSEIPLSPIFSRYDLIPLPRDDPGYTPNMENSVQCTCKGFKTPDVIRLCQKFRTHKLSDVAGELKDTLCTFCMHPLSSHTHTPKQDSIADFSNILYSRKPVLGPYEGLSLADSSSLPFPPVSSDCLEVILPASFMDFFAVVSIGSSQDSDALQLAVVSEATNDHDMKDPPSDVVSSGGDDKAVSALACRKRTREKHTASKSQQRKSRRLATRKVREEEGRVLKQLKGLKGIGRCPGDLDGGEEAEENRVQFSEVEFKQVLDSTLSFVKRIGAQDNYRTFCLPQELLDGGIDYPLMAALRVADQSSALGAGQDSSPGASILVAVGAKESQGMYVAVVPPEGKSLRWHQLNSPGVGTLECLLLRRVETADSANEVLVGMGTSSGVVCVWKVVLAEGRLQDTSLDMHSMQSFSCGSQCTALSLAPDSNLLVAGTVLGEAVFCSLSLARGASDGHIDPLTIQCCNAPVQCITWSDDGRLLAIGACDDIIQVLQCVTPSQDKPIGKGSLYNYFKRTEASKQPKFIHTHTLKGHTSFVADMQFSLGGYLLVSLGWGGQLLFWRLLPLPDMPLQSRPRRPRAKVEPLRAELVEPAGGYKLGPSLAVEFLPLKLGSMMGCGLVVAMANKLGGVTVAGYAKQSVILE